MVAHTQVKQQQKTHHLGNLIAANNVDYPNSEMLLQVSGQGREGAWTTRR